MVKIADHSVYAVEFSAGHHALLCRYDSAGRLCRTAPLPAITDASQVRDIENCGGVILLESQLASGLDAVQTFSPNLETIEAQGLFYNGVYIRGMLVARVGGDTAADLLVIRESPTGERAVDVFSNNTGTLENELQRCKIAYADAAQARDRAAMERAGRRLQLLSAQVGQGTAVAALVTDVENRYRQQTRRRQRGIVLASVLGLCALGVLLAGVVRWRRKRPSRSGDTIRIEGQIRVMSQVGPGSPLPGSSARCLNSTGFAARSWPSITSS